MSTEYVTSTGALGQQFDRSCGRAYWNVESTITNGRTHLSEVWDFQRDAYFAGRRRWVVKGIYTPQAVSDLRENNAPIEAQIPLNLFTEDRTESLLYIATNFHRSEVPEWGRVFDYWRYPNGCEKTPLSRIGGISQIRGENQQYTFVPTADLRMTDTEQLAEIWKPFGWTDEGINQLRHRLLKREGVWFSGIVDRQTNRLVSACMGEQFEMAGVTIVESTEYGTLPQYQGMGLCTSAISFLNAQILNDTLYHQESSRQLMPVILAELSMTSRSDIAARHAGFRVPLIDQHTDPSSDPFQVLSRNVSILDNQPVNDLDPAIEHRTQTGRFNAAYADDYGYWRNFIVGVLPKVAIQRFYSAKDVAEILSLEGRKKVDVSC